MRHTIWIVPKEWRLVKIAARQASILEGVDVSASEIVRRGALLEAERVQRKWESEYDNDDE